MYKTYVFLEGEAGADPFRYRGAEGASAVSAQLPALAGYTQTRTLDEQIDASEPPPFVGIAELYFTDIEAALDTTAQADAVQSMLTEAGRIGPISVGLARTVLRLAAHHDGGLIKGVFPFRRKADLSVADFQAYWWLHHGPIAALTQDAVYYLQCHPLPASYEQGRPPYDGITELHWRDVGAARAAMASRQMTEDQANDSQNFVEPGSVLLFLAEEEVLIPA